MNLFKTTLTALAAALLCAASFAAGPGQPAPAFSLTDIHGKTHQLTDYAGKIVVLEWTNYGCPYVKHHYNSGSMQKLQAAMAGKEIVWLSICSSKPGSQGHMSSADWVKEVDRKGVKSAAVLIDESGKTGRAYGAMTSPHMYVIDPQGIIAYNGAIDSIPTGSAADIARAENYVVAAVEALQSGKPVAKPSARPYGCGIKYARDS